jgi:basic amino acid/polyamine antiporter, APA family
MPSERGSLLKILGVAFGLAILVGNTIGMGILRTPGEVAAHVPSVPLYMGVWVAGALYALLGALTVAELAAMHPRSGGQYSLVSATLGPYPAFIVGWGDWLSTCGSVAAVAMVLGEYVGPLIPAFAGHESLTASAVIVIFGVLQWSGIRIGDLAQQATSLIKAFALVALAVVALVVTVEPASTAAATTVVPVVPGGVALFAALILALQSAIYTYDGWTGPIYFGEELRDPARDIPRSMIGGVLLVLAIYLLLNAAFLRIIPIEDMAGDPFVAASAAVRLFGQNGDLVLRIVMVLSLVASVNALVLMASRIPFAMSRDKFLPPMFSQVNAGGTPVPAHILSILVALVFIATNTFETVISLLAFMFVTSYTLTFSGFFASRWKNPDAERPFKVPAYPLVPGLALAGSAAFMVAAIVSDRANSLIAIGLIAASWPVYRSIRR